MITHITVDGFKSLRKFELDFRIGLNVLIGPNGAGKSNICQALGLISAYDCREYYKLSSISFVGWVLLFEPTIWEDISLHPPGAVTQNNITGWHTPSGCACHDYSNKHDAKEAHKTSKKVRTI